VAGQQPAQGGGAEAVPGRAAAPGAVGGAGVNVAGWVVVVMPAALQPLRPMVRPERRTVGCVTTSKTAALVRTATQDDVPRICEICSTAYAVTYRDLLPADYIERTIRDFYQPERVGREVQPDPPGWYGYQVVEEAGRVLGAAGGGITAPGVGELFVIYLDPAERGRGLGTLLLDRVVEQVRSGGAREMWVSVTPGNEKGIPFYQARGFEFVEKVKAYSSLPSEDIWSLRMRKALDPAGPAEG
jgi:ribosomal protein S18 acetylase RimI-like enzyme